MGIQGGTPLHPRRTSGSRTSLIGAAACDSAVQAARMAERRRVSHELHDGPAQLADALYMHLRALAAAYPPSTAEARERLDDAVRMSESMVAECRRVMGRLGPAALERSTLWAAILAEAGRLRASGIEVTCEAEFADRPLPPDIEATLYRAAQEALANIRRHAGARHVSVRLRRSARLIRLTVSDDGRGFDGHDVSPLADGRRRGLATMAARLGGVGGTLSVASRRGAGTRIVATIPADAVRAGQHD